MTVLLALTGCSNATRELRIQTAPTEFKQPDPRPAVPDPRPVQMLETKFVVITADNLPQGADWVYIALTPKDYENLSRNIADLHRWIKEARWRLRYYKGELEDGREANRADR